MTAPVMASRFPHVPKAMGGLLVAAEFVLATHTGTQTPGDLEQQLPFVRIVRGGGPSDMLNDYALVDVDVFHATPTQAEDLAERIRQYLTGRPVPSQPPVTFDRITCENGPVELPWGDNPGVARYGAEYRVVSRRHHL